MVVFRGFVDPQTVLREFAESAISVLPSLDEAFGYAAVESMSVGTPVVASRAGGLAEVIRDSVDGFLVEPGNPTELSSAIVRLLGDESLRNEMGKNARARFEKCFDLEKQVKNFGDWLERASGSQRERGVRGTDNPSDSPDRQVKEYREW